MKNEELIRKWLLDQLTKEEEESFKRSADYADIVKIWGNLPNVATPPALDVESEWEKFRSSRLSKSKAEGQGISWPQRLIGIAASLVIISILSYLFLNYNFTGSSSIKLSESQVEQYLPDSSIVVLNKGSELVYNKKNWAEERSVKLEGEAFFRVKKGSTFDVVTSSGMVTVLGTSFNVKQRNQVYEVKCFEGKVGVEIKGQKSELTSGQGFQLINEETVMFNVEGNDEPDWMKGKSTFYKMPYRAVLSELENQYDLVIETNDVNLNDTFTGNFPHDDLKIALDVVTAPSAYNYQINENKVLISRGNQ
ncbi:MAG: hypothetical protein DSY77_06315 [Bacteroidetes bacterium]|uniref:FecR family protein n=1 Tax=Marivirga tractuosa TaxID=1006 RepID=UPI000FFFFA88|nr:MAG: hypothetical protein DSY77_06315 [Bacteroidota bacterium]